MLCLCISRLLSLKMMMREVLHHRSNKNVSKAVFYHHMLVVKQFTFDAFILYLWLPTWSKVTISLQRKNILENEDNRFKRTPRHWLCAGSCFVRYTVSIFPTTEETLITSTAECVFLRQTEAIRRPRSAEVRNASRMSACTVGQLSQSELYISLPLMNHHFHIW